MSKDSGFEMASQTVNDVSQISLSAERGAENLMLDVNSARAELGGNSQCFSDYDQTVSHALEKNGTLPMLSLGHAKNNFDKMDLDRSGDLSRDELIIAREQSGSKVEASMLTLLSRSFGDIRSAHESNKYNPFSEDDKGITLDDLNAKLKEGQSNMDRASVHFEQEQRHGVMEEIAGDLLKSRGVSFSKLARGDRDGKHDEIEKSDLEELLIKDNRTKEFGADTLTAGERKAAEYMVKNWDSSEVELMRKDVVTYPDAFGPGQRDKGGITLSRMDRILTGGIEFDAINGISPEASAAAGLNYVPRERTFVTIERIPDEGAVAAKDFNRLSKEFQDVPLPDGGTQQILTDRNLDEFMPDRRDAPPPYAGTDQIMRDNDLKVYSATKSEPAIGSHEVPAAITNTAASSLWNTFEAASQSADRHRYELPESDNLPEWKVQKGQYLWMIAEHSLQDNGNHKPSFREINDMTNSIAKENNIHRNDYLKVGQKLRVPQTRNGRM
ncbi:MAG: LysM peptidoglycan-binding domain-containing protein [Candidatus Melainabacteria bacterium]|nr:LysM peptidoglycan-binding domain-containing protein [Candidatus Melainabacteria bacterium]